MNFWAIKTKFDTLLIFINIYLYWAWIKCLSSGVARVNKVEGNGMRGSGGKAEAKEQMIKMKMKWRSWTIRNMSNIDIVYIKWKYSTRALRICNHILGILSLDIYYIYIWHIWRVPNSSTPPIKWKALEFFRPLFTLRLWVRMHLPISCLTSGEIVLHQDWYHWQRVLNTLTVSTQSNHIYIL